MRQFELQRDLRPLADLIELSFKDELDGADARVVAEMRRMADTGPLLWLFGGYLAALSRFMRGYVWIEDGCLVGNVTLSLENGKRGLWTISNVAVHLDHRGRGLARRLVSAALNEARDEGGRWIMLEVRADNPGARHVYEALGFELYDTVAEMNLPAREWKEWSASPLPLRRRRAQDWQSLDKLYKEVTPSKLQEFRPIPPARYRLGLDDRLNQWMDDLLQRRTRGDWVLEEHGEVAAFLQVVGYRSRAPHRLEMAVRPDKRGSVEVDLLEAGLRQLARYPRRNVEAKVSLSHAEAHKAYQAAGFLAVRVLDQMRLDLRHPKGRVLP